jgi:hypothetical protein
MSAEYDTGYNAAGKTYLGPDGDSARAAIWFDGCSNYTIDHNTFLHDYHDMKACEGPAVQLRTY